jgi:hypothetical protein
VRLNVVDDERLRAQFDVQSRDVFYMTGTMQLTVLRRLLGEQFHSSDRTARVPIIQIGRGHLLDARSGGFAPLSMTLNVRRLVRGSPV